MLGMMMHAHIELMTFECGCRVRSTIMFEVGVRGSYLGLLR